MKDQVKRLLEARKMMKNGSEFCTQIDPEAVGTIYL
jgi:hypothetical protein